MGLTLFATSQSASVVLRDYKGKKATCKLRKATTLNDARQFAEALATYSRAAVISYSHTETNYVDDNKTGQEEAFTTVLGEHYDRVEQKCKLLYKDADSGDMISVSIPAPNDSCFDGDQEPTSKMAEDFADAIGTATTRESKNLIYMGGGLSSKLSKIRKARRSGV